MESFLYTAINLAVFSIDKKTAEKKETMNISDSLLDMSFLRNFNTLVGILLGPTGLSKSNEDMTFSISVLSVGLTKMEIKDLFLRKSETYLCKNEVLSLVLLAVKEKSLLKIFEIAIGLEIVV